MHDQIARRWRPAKKSVHQKQYTGFGNTISPGDRVRSVKAAQLLKDSRILHSNYVFPSMFFIWKNGNGGSSSTNNASEDHLKIIKRKKARDAL